MDTLNNIRPGDRINISFSDSKVNKNNYKSSISDLISDDTWEITIGKSVKRRGNFRLCDLRSLWLSEYDRDRKCQQGHHVYR